MISSPKPSPRFLPILTEVVNLPSGPEPGPLVDGMDVDAMVDQVMQAVTPHIESQLRELVNDLVQEKVRELTPRIQQDLAVMVRAAVEGAVTEMSSQSSD